MKLIHGYGKYVVDVVLVLVWIWLPMYYFGLKDASMAWLWWIVDLATLAYVIYNLHQKAGHALR